MIYSCDDYRAAVACENHRLYDDIGECEECVDDEFVVIDEDLKVYASAYTESEAFDKMIERFTEEEIEERDIQVLNVKDIALWN